jgi:hypothetical protein
VRVSSHLKSIHRNGFGSVGYTQRNQSFNLIPFSWGRGGGDPFPGTGFLGIWRWPATRFSGMHSPSTPFRYAMVPRQEGGILLLLPFVM